MNKHNNNIVSLLPKIILRELYANKIKKKLKILKQTDIDILSRFNLTGGANTSSDPIQFQIQELNNIATDVINYNKTVGNTIQRVFNKVITDIINQFNKKKDEELNRARDEKDALIQEYTNSQEKLAEDNAIINTKTREILEKKIAELLITINEKNIEISSLNNTQISEEIINNIRSALHIINAGPEGFIGKAIKPVLENLLTHSSINDSEKQKLITELMSIPTTSQT